MARPAASSPDGDFVNFPKLPVEIQLHIWRFAIPDPYSITSAIVMIINPDGDLSYPRGFLPSPKKLVLKENQTAGESIYACREDLQSRQPIFNVMQSCRNARALTLEIYRLDICSKMTEEHVPLTNDPDDMVYFHLNQNRVLYGSPGFSSSTMAQYMTCEKVVLPNCFETLRHVAFHFSTTTLEALDFYGYDRDYTSDEDSDDFVRYAFGRRPHCRLQQNFPSLESISLFVDPLNCLKDGVDRKLVLFPVDENIRINQVNMTSDVVEDRLETRFARETWAGTAPVVDTYVVVKKVPRRQRR